MAIRRIKQDEKYKTLFNKRKDDEELIMQLLLAIKELKQRVDKIESQIKAKEKDETI